MVHCYNIEVNKFYFVYVLLSHKDNKFYIGSTNNLKKGLSEHHTRKEYFDFETINRGLMEEFGATGRTIHYIGAIVSTFPTDNYLIEKTTL